jgi:hypothetical protein
LKIHVFHRPLLLAAALCGLVLLAGCSDDREKVPTARPDLVQVMDEADGSPVAGIKVVVMDPWSNLPVAGPLVSGTDGICNFGHLPEDDHRLLVFGGVDYRVHALPDYRSWTKIAPAPGDPGGLFRSSLLPTAVSGSSNPVAAVEVLVRKMVPDSLPRISGLVVEEGTGAPLDRVFVSLSFYLTGYQGGTLPSDDVTGDDGYFSVSQIPFALDQDTGNLIQVNPLRFTRHGYRPVVWRYDSPNGSDNVDISGVTIAMTPLDGGDEGSISGRLLRDKLPATDITVGLGVLDMPGQEKGGPGLPGWTAITDQDGRFTIGRLPAGTYLLQPGFLLADGAFFLDLAGNVQMKIEAGQAVDAGDLIVLHEIEPQAPAHGLALDTTPTSLDWTPVPGAKFYEVRFDRGVLPLTDTNSIELPESLLISPGLHVWYVRAGNEDGELVGAMQIQAKFRLLPPP